MEGMIVEKVRIVKSKNLAGALVWLGFSYIKDEEDNFIFKRSYGFDLAFKALHSTRSNYHRERWEIR